MVEDVEILTGFMQGCLQGGGGGVEPRQTASVLHQGRETNSLPWDIPKFMF